jgi:hypothetical protein
MSTTYQRLGFTGGGVFENRRGLLVLVHLLKDVLDIKELRVNLVRCQVALRLEAE